MQLFAAMPFVPDVTGPGLCVVVKDSELEELGDVVASDDGSASNMEEEEEEEDDDDGGLLLLVCRPTPTPTPIPTPRLTAIRVAMTAKVGIRNPQMRLP